ncbi:MAG: peptide deformylase, partial [Calditrichaceae bacterium]
MYKVRIIGDSILRKKTTDIDKFDNNLQLIINEMIDTMHKEDGIGLAAPQVGLDKSLLVIDISSIDDSEEPTAFINPEIINSSGEAVYEEGCLSIPGVREEVLRPEEIILKYQDADGNNHKETFSGWKSRVLQHEIDHLNGVLFVDR